MTDDRRPVRAYAALRAAPALLGLRLTGVLQNFVPKAVQHGADLIGPINQRLSFVAGEIFEVSHQDEEILGFRHRVARLGGRPAVVRAKDI